MLKNTIDMEQIWLSNLRSQLFDMRSLLDNSRLKICDYETPNAKPLKDRLSNLGELSVKIMLRSEIGTALNEISKPMLEDVRIPFFHISHQSKSRPLIEESANSNSETAQAYTDLINFYLEMYDVYCTCLSLYLDCLEMRAKKERQPECWDIRKGLELTDTEKKYNHYRNLALKELLDSIKNGEEALNRL